MKVENEFKKLKLWLKFGYEADNVVIANDTCTFEYEGKEYVARLQILDFAPTSFVYNKETFDNELTVQIAGTYIAIINTEKAEKTLRKYVKHITKLDNGFMSVDFTIADTCISMMRYEEL